MTPTDPIPDRSEPASGSAPQPIVIDDLGRFTDTAAAFWRAMERVDAVRGRFAAAARDAGHALGDRHLAVQYDETFRGMLGALDAIEGCFEQFSDALSAAGTSYQQADDSVGGHMR
jgi:uncharacterized protein YukE